MADSASTSERTDATRDTLRARLEGVQRRVADAAGRVGRRPEDVYLVAVTKYAAIDQVRELIELGQVDLGESRAANLCQRAVQIEEYLERHRQLGAGRGIQLPQRVRWHMIGHLQRNKVRKLIDHVRLVHSVDSLRLAEEIQAAAARRDDPVEVLVQVNIAGEKQKHGVAPAAALHLVEQIYTMLNLQPRGLMCMAPYSDDPEASRPIYQRCAELFADIARSGAGGDAFNLLSMGMSNDYEVAVQCGANIVRVGRAIFGDENSGEGEGGREKDDDR